MESHLAAHEPKSLEYELFAWDIGTPGISLQRSEMFIETDDCHGSALCRSAMFVTCNVCCAPTERGTTRSPRFYKHLAPLERKPGDLDLRDARCK